MEKIEKNKPQYKDLRLKLTLLMISYENISLRACTSLLDLTTCIYHEVLVDKRRTHKKICLVQDKRLIGALFPLASQF